MRRRFNIRLWFLLLASAVTGVAAAAPLRAELREGWRFRQARLLEWHPASVPGVVHTDLLANGMIDDPFFRLNERSVQWVDKEDWIYQIPFDLPAGMRDRKHLRLRFEGLDTYADVRLNGELLFSADNMFRIWTADVTGKLRPFGNILEVYFHSPLKVDLPKWEALPYRYEAGNDQSHNGGLFAKQVSVFARKAGYHYGWDWGPRLVTSGIWRPVVLEAWDDARIADVLIEQRDVTLRSAEVTMRAEVLADRELSGAQIAVYDDRTGKLLARTVCDLEPGGNTVSVGFRLRNPRLWWCNGLGSPELYDFRTELILAGRAADSRTTTTGIRSVELVRERDEAGRSFYFRLNGVPVFAKGANYIPSDSFLPRVTPETYEKTVADAAAAHMNMLRVWGGGIYECDLFYELCDRYGLMVWQDFMFACSLYPAEGEFLENIRREAVDNVKRLRNHPSVVVWCGNNENQTAWFGWGWKESYERQNPAWAEKIWKQYCDQYFITLADVVAEYGNGIAYTPSSPLSAPDKGQEDNEGDRHFWGVWNAQYPIAAFNDMRSRFFSEYGFQSFPEFASVKRYAPWPDDWNITSDAMMWHQRGGTNANQRIRKHMLDEYREPKDFEHFLYMSQLLQGDAVKIAMEAHRRDKPNCMGSLYWQIIDCWPVASWSSRDYYGRWKALHYFAAKAFDDVLVSPVERDGVLEVWVVSDRLQALRGLLDVAVYTMTGKRVGGHVRNIRLKADESLLALAVPVEELLGGHDRRNVVIRAGFTPQDEQKTYTNYGVLTKQKEINYLPVHIDARSEPAADGFRVTLRSDTFARGVCLSLQESDYFFSDNYFDLLPGYPVTVEVHTSLDSAEFQRQLTIKTLRDAY